MKTLRLIGTTLLMVMLAVNFTACSDVVTMTMKEKAITVLVRNSSLRHTNLGMHPHLSMITKEELRRKCGMNTSFAKKLQNLLMKQIES